MKKTRIFAATLACGMFACSGGAFAASAEKSAPKIPKRYTIEQFMATTALGGASFSADEKRILFHSNESGIFNAYTLSVAGGKPEALTRSTTDTTFAVSHFQNDDRILYTRDRGGDENNHLYVRELDGSEKDLTPGDKLKASFAGWRADGSAFFVSSNERDPKVFVLYRYDAKSYARTLFYKNGQAYSIGAISRDEKWIALNKTNTSLAGDIYLFDVTKAETRHLTPHSGAVNFSAATFDPSSQRLFLLTDEGSEFARLRTYDLASAAMKDHEKADWDVVSTYFSRDGRFRVTAVNQDGSIAIRVVEGADEKPVRLPVLPGGEIRGVTFSRSGARMAFYLNGDRSPNNLYVYDFKSKQARALTQSLSKEIDPKDLVEAQVARFKSFDGMVIPNIYYKPHGASTINKVPALVYVHGGPGGQTTRGYNAQIQYLVNHGYAVLGINNRGSSGYGKPSSGPMTANTVVNRCGIALKQRPIWRAWGISTPSASASSAAATVAT